MARAKSERDWGFQHIRRTQWGAIGAVLAILNRVAKFSIHRLDDGQLVLES